MKKNGYLRRFLALFLALVMIMADSSVTTFAATVGRVKQQNATGAENGVETGTQCSVQINSDQDFDLNKFMDETGYSYIMLGKINSWGGFDAASTIEKIVDPSAVVLSDVSSDSEDSKNELYFVKGDQSYQWNDRLSNDSDISQGENKFRISVTADENNANNWIVNITKVQYAVRTVRIDATTKFNLQQFLQDYKYAVLGRTTLSGIEAVSSTSEIDTNGTVELNAETGLEEVSDLYFLRNENQWYDKLSNGSSISQNNQKFKIVVEDDEDHDGDLIVRIVESEIKPGNSVTYTDVLGNAVYFGIVANTVEKQAHMDSNFATKVLKGASGNVTTGKYTENGAVYLVASVPEGGSLALDGKSNILWCTEENRNNFTVTGKVEIYPKETLDAYVDAMMNHVTEQSKEMAKQNSYNVGDIDNFNNNKTIDITSYPAGTYYFDMSSYAEYGIDDMKIKKNSNQVVVLNYPTSKKVTLKRFVLENDGVSVSSSTSDETVDQLCRSIIFNMPRATKIDFSSATAGLFIAPKATVTGLGGTSSGWIVVNKFTNPGGEWHCVYGELPKPENVEKPAQESFYVRKSVDGSTPTADQKFTFRLEQIGDAPNGTTLISAKTVENSGAKVDFGTIKYNKEGTYYYKITETGKAATTSGEYTLDSQSYVVKVIVTANVISSGNITTTEYNKVTTYYKGDTVNDCTEENKVTGTTGITFNNETIEQKGSLKIVKVAGAGTELVGKTFYFKVSDENGNVVKNSNNSDVWSLIFRENVENAINIENLKPGKYYVSETDANGNAVTTGEDFPYVVTNQGEVIVESGKATNVSVKNTYVAGTSIILEGTKSLSGRTLIAGEFTFQIKDKDGNVVATGTNDAAGKITFSEIKYGLSDMEKDGSYESEKTFTYKVSEVKGATGNGITYDDSEYTVKVKVSYDQSSGEMTAELVDKNQKLAFTNSYDTETGIALEGTKSLRGRTLKDQEFKFEVKDENGTVVATGTNDATGKITFSEIKYGLSDMEKDGTYASKKTYEYTVNEVIPEGATAENGYTVNGVTYDNRTVSVKVTVTYDQKTGEMKAELAKDSEAIAFQNSYDTETSIGLGGTKGLSGRDLKAAEFTFEVKDKDGKVVATGTNKADGSISFDKELNYKLSDLEKEDGTYASKKTYEYTVNEVIPKGATEENGYTVNGVTYDSKTVNVKVTVTYDQKTGELKAELAEDSEAIAFQNSYDTETSIGLGGTKGLSGRDLKAAEFTFEVKDKDGKVVATGTNKADGSISFDKELNYKLSDLEKEDGTYESEKTYEYTVNEVIPEGATAEKGYTVNGVTYDSKTVNVKVTVTYDQKTGEMKAELAEDSEAIAFQNSYDTETSIGLGGTKGLSGRDLKAAEFTFEVKDKDGKVVATGSNDADGKISFSKISYKLSDLEKEDGTYASKKTYEYTVNEVIPEGATAENGYTVNGVTYDSKTVNVKVTVTYDQKTGEMKAELSKDSEAIAFQNSYDTETSIGLGGTKGLSGRDLKAAEFTFEVKDKDGKVVATGSNDADGKISFSKISYTLSDLEKEDGTYASEKTYEYTVNEVIPEGATEENGYTVDGVTYANSIFTVKVIVSYDQTTGIMSAAFTDDSQELVFTNEYNATGETTLTATKTLSGREFRKGDNWKFTVTCNDANAPMPENPVVTTTATSGTSTTLDFGKIHYTIADVNKDYVYTITESGNVENVTNDPVAARTVTVSVRDNGDGTLNVTQEVTENGLTFTNKYADGETTLGVTKVLSGREFQDGDEWTFTLTAAEGTPMPAETTVKTDATSGYSQSLSFGTIKYTLADVGNTYTYTIQETGSAEGVTNDPNATRTVTVTVSEGKDGKLDIARTESTGGTVFTNIYDASGSTELKATKNLSGREFREGDNWTFTVTCDDEKAPLPEHPVVTTNVIGGTTAALDFGKINYTLADAGKTYTYTITESGSVDGVTNDVNTSRTVTVKITDQKDGTLKVEKTEDDQGLTFTNVYDATGSAELTATKNLSGREFQEGDNWTFTVTCDDEKAPLPEHPVVNTTATSGTTTTLDFGKINYTLADAGKSYVYTITESGNVENVTNDPVAARTVTVNISDNGDGTLNVTQEVTEAGLTFTNKYADGETTLGVTKVLSGREFQDGDEWTFTLTAAEGTPMPAQTTVKTDATSGYSQSLSFGTIKYTLADAGNTYTYTIQETGSAEGVTNDPNATRTVTVEVSEGKDGKLNITKTESDGGTVFTNTYAANGSLTLEASKKLKNKAVEAGAFSFVLKDENGETIRSAVNDADGNVTFDPINYTLENVGTHTYTVSEVQKEDSEVTYDTTVYTVVVTVADAGDGTLNVSKTIKKDGDTVATIAFENIYKGVIEISGTKNWVDENNQDGIRPTSITVNLFANGTKVAVQKVTPDANGDWNYVFKNLPQYDANGKITYKVTEDVVDGYETSVNGYNITNTHKTETIDLTGTKTWNDSDNQDGKRPESITVILLANGTEKDRQTVTADEAGNWTYSFKDLPKYANGEEITYTVSEETVADYTTTYDGNNIINSYTPGQTSATVTKIWDDAENQDGKRPESITVSLLADGKATGTTVTLNAENNWTQTVSDLPEKANGKAIEYTWTEVTLPEGYELTNNSKDGTVTTLTNTYAPETTSITGTKTWDDADNQDGKRPESITINLLANGEIAASQTVTADEAGNWTYTFTDLPKYANGEEITYTVTENAVEGYETSVDGFNITNAYTTETTEVKGSKTWNDADDQDGKRPESITVRLLANGEEKDSKTVTADENGNWTYSFENLPKYETGKEIVYTVTEDAVADYTTEITGYDITNSYAPGKTSVTVTKAWADNNDRDGHRPSEIKVQLKADGENSGEEIILNAENKWTYTWSDLDEKKAGKDIAYTVEEIGETAGYISTVTGDATEGFIITNTITSVRISKVDITDQKELAGAHIQVIDKDGNVVDEWDSAWEPHEVTGLKTGEKYTLRETVAPDGYTITADTTFVLKEDGTLDKDNTSTTIADDGRLLVEDSRTSVKVSKVDISDGEELEGAHIQIIDEDGNIVDEWDSTKEAHVTEKLKTGKTYTLRETVAPDGYLLTNDTTFVLKEDGTVDTEKTTTVSKDGVLLVQDSLATSASIAVTKRLTYVGENLVARDQTFYVALYSDEECTKRVSDVKALEFKNSDASTVVFSENIKAGKTYYIAECTEDGTSQVIGALADGTTYEAVFGDGNSTTVTEADGTTTVSFENVFSSFPPDGFYRQGQLTITKRVLGADGDTKNSDKVFYAGIFDDAAHTQLSQQVEQNIIELDMGGGYEVSEIINVGLAETGAKVTLYVTETDSNGKPIAGSEGFGYKVSVSADSVTIDENNLTAEVVITNQEEATETPTPTPSSDDGNGGGSEDHSGSYGGKSPKTGDDTPIGTYLMLLLAAAMLAAETERRRRRNKR